MDQFDNENNERENSNNQNSDDQDSTEHSSGESEDNQTASNPSNDSEENEIESSSSNDSEGNKAMDEEQMNEQEMNQAINPENNQNQPNKKPEKQNVKKQQKPSKWKGFLGMIAAAILGSVITLAAVTQLDYFQPDNSNPNVENEQSQSEPVQKDDNSGTQPVSTNGSIADIADSTSDAIVGIVNMSDQPNPFAQTTEDEVERGVGSGVIYEITDDGAYIVTNNHVIEDASSLQVSLANGDTVDGKLVGTDPLSDIAVVEVKGDIDVEPIKFGDSEDLRTGDSVIAIGNPLGLDLSRTVTQGIVSATDRSIPIETSAGEWEFDVIQTDAAINPGNSGGALLNSSGELVGINTMKIGDDGVEGLGFSIPSNEVSDLVDELVETGKIVRPYAGVGLKSVREIPPHYLEDLPEDVTEGAVVLSIDEESAAAEAGIEVEDVIVSIDGEDIENDSDFRSYLYKNASIDDTVEIELYHKGKLKTVEVKLTSNEDVE